MKQIINISLLALLLGLSVTSKAQTPIDFEAKDYQNISVYDKWEHSPFRTGKLKGNAVVVANPNKGVDAVLNKAPNPSDSVLGFQSSRFGSNIFGARINLLKPWKTSPTTQYVHVMVLSPKKGNAMLVGLGKRSNRMEQSSETEQFWVRSLNVTQPDKWVDLVFPVKTANGVEIHSFVVVPYLDAPHRWNSDFLSYIDNIIINDSPLTQTHYGDSTRESIP